MSIVHSSVATGSPLIGAAEWNADHSNPTLAEVLAAGNDPAGHNIQAAAAANAGGAYLYIYPGLLDDHGGPVAVQAGGGFAGIPGGDVLLSAGYGNDGNTDGASVTLKAGDGSATSGGIEFYTKGTNGTDGQLLVNDGGTYAAWKDLYSEDAAAPTTLTTLLYGDTTAVTGGLYVWTGSAYRFLFGPLP